MSKTREQTPAFRVGDRVKFPRGGRTLRGVIVEDRGVFGPGGRRYRIEVPADPDEPLPFTAPEADLEPEDDLEERRKALTKRRIMEYLAAGGLIGILMRNETGGRNQPRVWLTLDHLGNVTYTFAADRGFVGGETVPFWTLHENSKIFTPKKEQVVSFLASFGLDRHEAEEVIRAIGTAP